DPLAALSATRAEAPIPPPRSVSAPTPAHATRPRIVSSSPAAAPSPAPMLAETGTPGRARGRGWAEIKWDGIRAIGTWRTGDQGGSLQLHARSGNDITARYPELTADGAPHLPAEDAVLDGEIVAFDVDGRPSFTRLQDRMHLTRAREIEREVVRTPIVYLVFDLLRLNGHDLTGMPLRQRRELLEQVVTGLDAPVQVPPVFDDVDAALAASREFGLEGVVVKDPGAVYRPGVRSDSWLKLKLTRMQEAVIVGIRPGRGDRTGTIGSLLLAVPDAAGGLRYIGRVGTGFTDRMLHDLTTRLDPLRTDRPSAGGVPEADASDALWVRPELIGEVEFANWTPSGILRHARWRGLRADKQVSDIRIES
ncbi:MAG: non-homologous end-joining DNA ligase, partial [Microbacterium sp.]